MIIGNCDCGIMIGAISALSGLIVTFFVGFNILNYCKIEKQINNIERERIRTNGFLHISMYLHFKNNSSGPNVEGARDALVYALNCFTIINDEIQKKYCTDQLKELNLK